MTTAQLLARASLALALFPVVGVAFAWLAWRALRRWHKEGLVATWIVSSIGLTLLTVVRINQQRAELGFTPEQQERLSVVAVFLPLWLVSFGAVAFQLSRSKYAEMSAFNWVVARGSIGAILAGALAYFVGFVLVDIAGVLRWP